MSDKAIQIQSLIVPIDIFSGFSANCYLIWREGSESCILIDAPAQPDSILEVLGGRKLEAIVLTHKHYDHIGAAAALVRATGAKVYAHVLDAAVIERGEPGNASANRNAEYCKVDVHLQGGEVLDLAGVILDVLHTPGHSPGSICLLNKELQVLFSGDTIFRGTTGRTDLAGGSGSQMHDSLIELSKLDDAIEVLPGHDQPTTIAYERNYSLIEY